MTEDPAKVAYDVGHTQWPTVRTLTLEAFRTFVDDAAVELEALPARAADLYLAAAASAGDEDAVKTFDAILLAELPRWLARLRLAPDVVEEVRQLLRSKLLVGPPPKLAQYRASGPLAAWVRVSAVRTALDFCEAAAGPRGAAAPDPLVRALDPEQQLIRQKYGALFERALKDAVAQLSKRDRNLLRFHYLSHMSFDAIARTYHVHRATVVRWLAAIRDDLDATVRTRLWQELGISPTELRSLWHAVGSDVDVSLSRLLVAE